MKKIYILLSFLHVIFLSCSKSSDMEFEYNVPYDSIQDSIYFTEIVDSIKYIKLETTDKCRIGNVKQTVIKNNRIYILSDGVFCFDINGKFIFSINKKGHSRNEYVAINNINIIDDTLYLYDNISNKILTFNSNNGKFISFARFSSGIAAVYGLKDMYVIDRHTMLYNDVKNDERFLLCSQNDIHDIRDSYFSNSESHLIVEGTTSVNDCGIFFTSYFGLKAWRISSKGCIPFIRINLPDKLQLSKLTIEKSVNNHILPSDKSVVNKIFGLSNIFETVNHIVGRLCMEHSFLYFVYNMSNKKAIFYKSIADAEPWQILPLDFSSSDENCLYKVIPSDEISLIRSLCGSGNKPIGNDLNNYETFYATEDSDNPVVAQFFLKLGKR